MEERYINPHTDFGFKQTEISKFKPRELKSYEDSMNVYHDIVNYSYSKGIKKWRLSNSLVTPC